MKAKYAFLRLLWMTKKASQDIQEAYYINIFQKQLDYFSAKNSFTLSL
jgi:hypothetical protein